MYTVFFLAVLPSSVASVSPHITSRAPTPDGDRRVNIGRLGGRTRENKRRGRISGEPATDDEERRDTDEKEETQESVVHGFRPERVYQRQITR